MAISTGAGCVKCKGSGDLGSTVCSPWANSGITTVYFINNGDFTYTKDACGNVNNITLCAYKCMYKGTIVDKTGNLTVTTEFGTTGYTSTVELVANFIGDDCTFYSRLESYLGAKMTAIVISKNKKIYMVGQNYGLQIQTVVDTTGDTGDTRALTVTFLGDEPALKTMVLYGAAPTSDEDRYFETIAALEELYLTCNAADTSCECVTL